MWWQIMMTAGTKQAAGSNDSASKSQKISILIGQMFVCLIWCQSHWTEELTQEEFLGLKYQ